MAKNPEGRYFPGQWLFYCDVCGKKMLSGDAKKRWDGLMVCEHDWEMRHPMDFLRSRRETSNILPWQRRADPGFDVTVGHACTLANSVAIAGVGVAGCMVAGATGFWEGGTTDSYQDGTGGSIYPGAIVGIMIVGAGTLGTL